MTSYIISQIRVPDRRAYGQQCDLLLEAGLPLHQPADFALGIYDQDYKLLATGSLYGNELHSIAVAKSHRGKGLLNQILTYLYEQRFRTGHCDLYITVPDDISAIFTGLGFSELYRSETGICMGNRHATCKKAEVLAEAV